MLGNVAGLRARHDKTKFQILNEETFAEIAILIVLTESRLSDNHFDSEIQLHGYTSYRTDRALGMKIRGVVTYVHNAFSASMEVLATASNSYVEYHMLYIIQLALTVITLYRPPDCPSNLLISPLEEMKVKLNALSACLPNIILTGNFNLPTVDWNCESVYGGSIDNKL